MLDLGFSNSDYILLIFYKSILEYLENNKNKVQVHCPHRKNMKEKTPTATKKKLKKRYIIEHVFKDLKKYNRIYLRKQKDIKHYMSFMYLAVIKEFNKH